MKIDSSTRALVTGASSGIGRAVARALAARGAQVVLAARRADALAQLADELAAHAPRPIVIAADLARPGEAARLAARAVEEAGGIDLLVNNAGTSIKGRQDERGDDAEARALFELNYFTPLALTRALVPAMRARKSGAVVNVSSVSAITPMPRDGHYSSTKAALSLATEALRMELAQSGVDVLLVMPGPIETPLLHRVVEESKISAGILARTPTGDADTLAQKILAGVERRRARLIYPGALHFVRRFPNFSLWATHRLAPRLSAN